MKKLRWVSVVLVSVLAACGSLWIAQQNGLRQSELTGTRELPTLRPAHQEPVQRILPTLGERPTLADVQKLYRQGQQQLYNSHFGGEYLRAREFLQQARALLGTLEIAQTEKLYWQARLEFELGNWYQGAAWQDVTQAQEALPYYLTTEQLAQQLTEQAPDFSEGHRLLGETQMRIISLRGWLQALTHAGAAHNALERALELDPHNAEARLALGVYYLYAPALLGGNVERALREFHQIDALTSDETIRFLSYRWQGVAYTKLGKIEEAREAFRQALAIYPKSSWDQNELRKLR